jgi:hypothetical protein
MEHDLAARTMPERRRRVLQERPIYFIVALWGATFRELFLKLLLPSLLAPGNIPALVNKSGARFLIATTRSDWNAMQEAPLMALLRSHVEVVLIEIPEVAPGEDKYLIMTRAHKLAADSAIEGKAFGMFLCPDTLLSDGTVKSLQERAAAGAKVVLVAAFRHDQESFLAELYASAAYRPDQPLALAPRDLMAISLRHLHRQVIRRDFEATEFAAFPGFCIWRAPDQDGVILHNARWGPLLFSYGDLNVHHATSNYAGEGHVSIDDDYVYRNYGNSDDIQVITDSDEITYISITEADVLAVEPLVRGDWLKRICLRMNSFGGVLDPLQGKLFRTHIRLHTADISSQWIDKERGVDALLDKTIEFPPTIFDQTIFKVILVYFVLRQLAAGNTKPLRTALRRPYRWGVNFVRRILHPKTYHVDPNRFSFTNSRGRKLIALANVIGNPKTAAFLVFGQSNVANESDANAIHIARAGVYNFNFLDGRLYEARDPLLGPTGNGSNVVTRLGDLLIENGDYENVVLIPIAHGGTSVADWSPGSAIHRRLAHAIERIKSAGIELTAIMWQQGEAETHFGNRDPDVYKKRFLRIVAFIRDAGITAPIYVAQCSRIPWGVSEPIRLAQQQLADAALGILAGPDIDSITERDASGHFNAIGLQQAAKLWHETLRTRR